MTLTHSNPNPNHNQTLALARTRTSLLSGPNVRYPSSPSSGRRPRKDTRSYHHLRNAGGYEGYGGCRHHLRHHFQHCHRPRARGYQLFQENGGYRRWSRLRLRGTDAR